MTKERLIDFGANLAAMQYLIRWTVDPNHECLSDYAFDENIYDLWSIFFDELKDFGGDDFEKGECSVYDFKEIVWQHCDKMTPLLDKKMDRYIEETQKKYDYKDYISLGKIAKQFFKDYIEIIIETALKLGAINRRKVQDVIFQGQD